MALQESGVIPMPPCLPLGHISAARASGTTDLGRRCWLYLTTSAVEKRSLQADPQRRHHEDGKEQRDKPADPKSPPLFQCQPARLRMKPYEVRVTPVEALDYASPLMP
jgi:hypothetical protein